MANDLLVRILGDSRSLERAFSRSSKSASTFGRDMDKSSRKFGAFAKGAAAGLGVAIGTGGAIQGIKAVVNEASNLNEQMSRTRVVFEKSADSVVAWSQTTARSMGIAQSSALEAAGTFGAMFDQAGQSSAEAARLSKAVVQLASDLASFNNTSVDDALTALRSGLSGEIEPLRRFQVFLTEAAVSQKAMADSGKTNVRQLTQGEKILARYALIMKQTGKQQGDFARTSDSLANQQRILSAEWKNASAELGRSLLPAMIKVTEASIGIMRSFHNVTDASRLMSASFRNDLADAFGMEFVRDTLAKAGPALEAAMRDFEASIDPFDIIVPINLVPKFTTTVDPADFAKQPGVDFSVPKGAPAVSAHVAARNREILAQARGDLKEVLAIQVKRREGLKRLLDAALENGAKQEKINDLAERYARAQADVIGTQQSIAANAKAIAAEAKATAEAAADKAAADKKAAAARAAELRQARIAAEQIRQFRALGLDRTGAKPPPTIKNLLKQITQVGQQDLTGTQRGVLARIRKVLVDPLHKATAETRAAAKGLIDGIREALDIDMDKAVGPLTKTSALNANKILDGLGLGRDMEKELRARLSSFNSAGLMSSGRTGTATTGGGGAQPIVVNTTVKLDGKAVGQNTKRFLINDRRHNPPQKRGPNAG